MLRLRSHRLSHTIISRRNWDKTYPLLLSAIQKADFVAFDYELTGLHEKTSDRYIGVSQSYEAHCVGAKQFVPVQLGLCAATYNRDTDKWSLTPASIYLYPGGSVAGGNEVGVNFSVSTAALNFLVSNGFDCNEWISQGLGWLRPGEEDARKKSVKSKIDELKVSISALPTSAVENAGSTSAVGVAGGLADGPDKETIDSLLSEVRVWLESGESENFQVPMESAFLRLLAHSAIGKELPSLFSHTVRLDDDTRVLRVYRNKNELLAQQLVSLEAELEQIDRQLGARGLFDELSRRSVPLVGHNCFYDLLHTYNAFYEEVPPYVDQFKQKWLSKFSRTFDTKFLAESNEVLGGLQPPGTLKGLCDFMMNSSTGLNAEITPLSSDFVYHLPSSGNGDNSHDAGYDAMMTSLVFLSQVKHILERRSLRFDQVQFGPERVKPTDQKIAIQDLLKSACNRVRLVKTQPPSINLKERES